MTREDEIDPVDTFESPPPEGAEIADGHYRGYRVVAVRARTSTRSDYD